MWVANETNVIAHNNWHTLHRTYNLLFGKIISNNLNDDQQKQKITKKKKKKKQRLNEWIKKKTKIEKTMKKIENC